MLILKKIIKCRYHSVICNLKLMAILTQKLKIQIYYNISLNTIQNGKYNRNKVQKVKKKYQKGTKHPSNLRRWLTQCSSEYMR